MRPNRPPAQARLQLQPARGTYRIALASALLVLLIVPAITLQRTPFASASTGDAVFHDMSVTASFPEWISFRLDVASVTPIASAELFWASDGSPSFSVSAATISQGPRVVLEHEIDMTINYHPPGVDIIYFWRVTNTAGRVTESPRQAFLYMDERHEWSTRTNGPVTLYWYAGGDAFADDILDTSNRTVDRMRERFGVVGDRPIRIVIYGDDRDFSRSLPPNSAEWIGGQAYPQLNLIFAVVEPGAGAQREVRRMIPHEVSHLILNQATWNPYNSPPNWLDEGLAVYLQETHETRFQQILDSAVRDGRLIPIRALNSSFPLDPDQALLSYAESWSVVTFIIEEYGDDALARLIAVFRDEVSYDEAVQHALGFSIDELDTQWKDWLGYGGDAPPESRNSTTADDEVSFTGAEKVVLLSISAAGGLGGLGLGVYSIRRVRGMRSPR